MPKAVKVILVTATHHPMHKQFIKIAERLAKELNIEKEVKEEDYVFLIKYGETDDLGMAWLPQILIQLDNNEIKPVLTQIPFNEKLKPDAEKGYEEAIKKIKGLVRS